MKWFVVGVAILAGVFAAWLLLAPPVEQELPLIWGPILGAIADDSVYVSWRSDSPLEGELRYSEADAYDSTRKWEKSIPVISPAGAGEVRLERLDPGRTYRYQLMTRDGRRVYTSRIGRFTTPTPGLDSFSFLVYGDTRTFPERHRMVIEAMAKNDPKARFVVNTGDLVETPLDSRFKTFFSVIDDFARDHPYLAVIGNHEKNSPRYYNYLSLPKGGGKDNEEWWSMDYGTVHLIGLDSNVTSRSNGVILMREQIAWLKGDLQAAKERGARFIFVFFHHPLFSSDEEYKPGDLALRQLWHPIFLEYGVTAVFSGHCHNYERLIEEGINYIVTGGGGAPVYGLSPERVDGSQTGLAALHYVRVTISGDRAEIEMIPVGKVEGNSVTPLPAEPFDSITVPAIQPAAVPVGG